MKYKQNKYIQFIRHHIMQHIHDIIVVHGCGQSCNHFVSHQRHLSWQYQPIMALWIMPLLTSHQNDIRGIYPAHELTG